MSLKILANYVVCVCDLPKCKAKVFQHAFTFLFHIQATVDRGALRVGSGETTICIGLS